MKNVGKGLILALGLLSFTAFGQSQPTPQGVATITSDFCVSLDDSQPIQNFYEIDIAHLGFSSEYLAKKKFGHIANNLLTYHVDFTGNKVVLEVHIDRLDEMKDVAWWNEYLSSLCSE